jgi:cytochrome c-type biogenesis protein CcmE
MKPARIAIGVLIAIAIVAALIFTRAVQTEPPETDVGPLAVDQLAKNPAASADREVSVVGVVATVLPERGLFTIIDQSEYDACKVVTCAHYEVPVAFVGQLPDVEQLVTVTGQLVQEQEGRFLLQATDVELTP